MVIARCNDCGCTFNAINEACQNCGSNNRDIVSEDWGYGKEKAKVFVAELVARIGVKPSVDAAVSQALREGERGFWRKLTPFLKDNIVIDGFEIGFPSEVKVIFSPKGNPEMSETPKAGK
ncbi:MAG: hypothetical protein ISS52_04630 [Dehalococcoidia bacterium]|nr:hypothetical protein [Dehalococcoidia bacterium]